MKIFEEPVKLDPHTLRALIAEAKTNEATSILAAEEIRWRFSRRWVQEKLNELK